MQNFGVDLPLELKIERRNNTDLKMCAIKNNFQMQVLTDIQNINNLPCIISIFYPLILLFSKIIWIYNDLTPFYFQLKPCRSKMLSNFPPPRAAID